MPKAGKDVEEWKLMNCWWKCKLVEPHWNATYRSTKAEYVHALYSATLPLGVYSDMYRNINNSSICKKSPINVHR